MKVSDEAISSAFRLINHLLPDGAILEEIISEMVYNRAEGFDLAHQLIEFGLEVDREVLDGYFPGDKDSSGPV